MSVVFHVGYMFFEPYALMLLWRWHAVPMGAPTIDYWRMFGLSIFVAILTRQAEKEAPSEERAFWAWVDSWVTTSIGLFLGWLAS